MQVSVLIPSYNVAETVERAIDSVLTQSFAPFEVLVIDDASSDATRDLVRRISAADSRVRLIEMATNGGPSRARNAGLVAARGDVVALLDADDAWRPDRLEKLCTVMADKQADFVADNLVLYDSGLHQEVRLAHQAPAPLQQLDAQSYFQHNIFTGGFTFALLKPIMRRAFLRDHGIRYMESLRYGEDLVFMGEQLLSGARAYLTQDGYYLYTTRVGELSGQRSPHSRSQPDFISVIAELKRLMDRADGSTRAEIQRCIDSFRVVQKSNAARSLRREGRYLGYLRAMIDYDIINLLARQRFRRMMVRLRGTT